MQLSELQLNPYVTEKSAFSDFRTGIIVDLLESILIAALICGFIYIFVVTPNIVKGPSMFPTFKEGQLVLTTSRIAHWLSDTSIGESLGFGYGRGDVVVFHTPSGEDLIKRVIGLSGETIKVEDGSVFINDQRLTEAYLDNVETGPGTYLSEGEEIIIPENHFFMMGDNRPESRDSRDGRVGLVERDAILGKVILRYWPIGDFTVLTPGQITIQ